MDEVSSRHTAEAEARATAWLAMAQGVLSYEAMASPLAQTKPPPTPEDVRLSVRLPLHLTRRLQERAALQDRSLPTILSRCLAEALAAEPPVQLFHGNLPVTYAVLADFARRRNALPICTAASAPPRQRALGCWSTTNRWRPLAEHGKSGLLGRGAAR